MSLTLGLLSGASPAAALKFLGDLQAYTPVEDDSGHIRVIADINPRAPAREMMGGGGAGAHLAEAAGALRGAGAEVLAIADNSAHVWGDMIQRASGLPLIDMIQTAAAAAADTGARRVGVLGAKPAIRLYREYLAAQAMGLVSLPAERQEAFVAALADLKRGEKGPDLALRMAEFSAELVADGAEVVILGASELALVLDDGDLLFKRLDTNLYGLIDPAVLLAKRCVSICLGLEPAPVALD